MYIKNKKILFVGDVHGRYKELLLLIKKFPNYLIILLGDLQDRGKDSKKILDLILNNKNIIALKGNHEIFFLDFFKEEFNDTWLGFLNHGGIQTLLSYIPQEKRKEKELVLLKSLDSLSSYYYTDEFKNTDNELLDSNYYKENKEIIDYHINQLKEIKKYVNSKYISLIEDLPSFYKGDDWLASHAPIYLDSVEEALNLDFKFYSSKMKASKKEVHQIHGHTNELKIRNENGYNVYSLDNSRNNQLCGLDWKNKTIHTINNL